MQPSIEVRALRKRYRTTVAVDGLSFTVRAGEVTGFVGPNGAGKSTTMRLILGLDSPDEGEALVSGRPYRSLRTPLTQVGALLDAAALHPGRRAYNHLLWLAQTNGIGKRRGSEVIDQVGLTSAARRRPRRRYRARAAAAAGHRRRPARRPAGAHVRRAGQRTRPGRHHLDPGTDAVAGRRGPGDPGLQPPHGRTGRHRRPPDHCRPRS